MSPQATLAHYRIVSKLGEGGMGEVWRATDTKLNRDVAIKVLPEALAQDADRLARFTREAQVLASLNHPNIAAIYGVEERALVMELVPGTTLAERIAAGAIPVEEAIGIARQIAEALEYAHERGVIHRDLKPANIKVTPEGRVKVLDFGLAKAMAADVAETSPMTSPTLTMRATQIGVILGTAAYMSPEQAKGKPVDRRADIWAFGVVLLEMLTGRQMYRGETVSETLASVIKDEPDLGALPEATPAAIRMMLQRCLTKDPRRRLRDIGEARFTLEEPAEDVAPAQAPTPQSRGYAGLAWTIVGVLGVACAAIVAVLLRGGHTGLPMERFTIDLGADAVVGTRNTVAISPDGTRIVYPVKASGSTQLATRLMDQSKATILPGTELGRDPFFSPDGRWIGFFARDKMMKVSVQGGAALTLFDSATPNGDRGASWGEDGTIIATLDVFQLFRVPEGGGKAERLVVKGPEDNQISYRWPQILPGGEWVLVSMGVAGGFDDASIAAISLKTGDLKRLVRGGYFGRYLPSGHLIFLHQGTLFAVPFDARKLEVRGTPAPIQEEVAGNTTNGGGELDVVAGPSGHGTLAYLPGKTTSAGRFLTWFDANGKAAQAPPLLSLPGSSMTPRISPDGKTVALSNNGDIFTYDLSRGSLSRITFSSTANRWPVWTPDGRHIVYGSANDGMWWTRADGSTQPERLLDVKGEIGPQSFSPDGRLLAYAKVGEGIYILPLEISDPDHPKPGRPEMFLRIPNSFCFAAFSPDGRWLAYGSPETGVYHVYVRAYREGGGAGSSGGKWQISIVSGRLPFWSRTGSELFYEAQNGQMMAAAYSAKGEVFSAENPRPWGPALPDSATSYPYIDLAPDGKRFIVLMLPSSGSGSQQEPVHATFLVNLLDELRRKMPLQ